MPPDFSFGGILILCPLRAHILYRKYAFLTILNSKIRFIHTVIFDCGFVDSYFRNLALRVRFRSVFYFMATNSNGCYAVFTL
ncbi:MAG: hypothetical protein JWQ54_2083 [Mucilaginibacter sp.]|nr:hypothetical protein [Mucilaginibacter sp.]